MGVGWNGWLAISKRIAVLHHCSGKGHAALGFAKNLLRKLFSSALEFGD
jgi:hypothetical protein